MALSGEALKKRLFVGRRMLIAEAKRAFGRGKYDREKKRLYSDDRTWYLSYSDKTKGVSIYSVRR